MAKQLRLDHLSNYPFDRNEEQRGFDHHAPAGIDGGSEGKRNRGGDERPGVGHKPQNCAYDSPEDRIWNTDQAQTETDGDAEGGIYPGQRQEIPTQSICCVVERLRGAVEIVGPDEADEPVAQIASLEKNENHKNDDDSRSRQRRQKG